MTLQEDILFYRDGPIATIKLNRPHKLNTLTPDMGRALFPIATEINQDETIRVVILIGTGERAFSAGSDVTVLEEYGTNWQLRNRADYNRAIWSIRKPTIAAIRGYAIGGGLELALACDIRLASPTAQFGAGEIKLGWNGGAGNTQLLPRLVGYGKALQMLLTGNLIDADEALRTGLIQELVPDDQLEPTAWNMATTIAKNAPIAAQVIKHLVRISESTSLEVGLAYENDLFAYCFTTQDSQEGIAAFREKRPPQFKGE
ncbi:MAG: enoyl-CoA hydratase/isomerase family protein [Ktedonobacteraceae bacterium]|nr:enoyl-CoA hydratase/isomerase family protein [Ktedonobacteraceae bacterium]